MSESEKLRERLLAKEAAQRKKLSEESDAFEQRSFSFLKNFGIIAGTLVGGYFLSKLIRSKKKSGEERVPQKDSFEGNENPPEKSSRLNIPKAIKQKLITMAFQVGLALLTAKIKEKVNEEEDASDIDSAEE